MWYGKSTVRLISVGLTQARPNKEKVSSLVDPTLCRMDSMLVDRSIERSIRDAEMRIAGFLSEHNLSFNVMDHFTDLLPKLCPDSKTATQFKSKHTKTKCIVRNALAPHFHQELVLSLQSTQFSVIIDETTDISIRKELTVVTRLYDKETMTIKCCCYDLLEGLPR